MKYDYERIKKDRLYRVKICEYDISMFASIYFWYFFKYKSAKFHRLWWKLLAFTNYKYLVLCAFRESSKTSLAKIKIIHNILYKKKKLMGYVAYEKEAAGEALFDIATWLQTNKSILRDFGNLFARDVNMEKQPEKKSMTNFVTTNGVRLTAISIRQSVRGKIFDADRPDFYVIDDFENSLTKKSAVVTEKVKEFIKELLSGLSPDAEVVFLCNKISDTGSVQYLMDMGKDNPDWTVSEIPLIRGIEDGKINTGNIMWKSRFVFTDEEAKIKNENIVDKSRYVKSIESMIRTLNADGTRTFEQEYLNLPVVRGDRFFNTEMIDMRISFLEAKKYQNTDHSVVDRTGNMISRKNYLKISDKWKYWGEYIVKHRYGISADVSEGYGRDSSVIQIFDYTEGRQVGEYESNQCPPDILGRLMVEAGQQFGNCLLTPERNSIGVAVINQIKSQNYRNIYREKTIDKISNKPVHKFGFHTNAKTKPEMLFELRRDFENGLIEINSVLLLKEMRSFTNSDLDNQSFDPSITNHNDRILACAIVWAARKHRTIRHQ